MMLVAPGFFAKSSRELEIPEAVEVFALGRVPQTERSGFEVGVNQKERAFVRHERPAFEITCDALNRKRPARLVSVHRAAHADVGAGPIRGCRNPQYARFLLLRCTRVTLRFAVQYQTGLFEPVVRLGRALAHCGDAELPELAERAGEVKEYTRFGPGLIVQTVHRCNIEQVLDQQTPVAVRLHRIGGDVELRLASRGEVETGVGIVSAVGHHAQEHHRVRRASQAQIGFDRIVAPGTIIGPRA